MQVEQVVACITTACPTCHVTNFNVASCRNMLCKVDPNSTFCNKFFQLTTLKFVAWQVEHEVVTRQQHFSTCNTTMLHDMLNKNVAHIAWPSV